MASESQILSEAARAVEYRYPVGVSFSCQKVAEEYFRAKLAGCEREVFAVAFLTNQHVLIEYRELFAGTINCVEIKPREIVKVAMSLNAAAVILSHNHPSYSPEPSRADIDITRRIRGVFDELDVRVLDHIIVAGNSCISMAARGLI
nr:JAB domain-containing protein [Pantoea multigeneris]